MEEEGKDEQLMLDDPVPNFDRGRENYLKMKADAELCTDEQAAKAFKEARDYFNAVTSASLKALFGGKQ